MATKNPRPKKSGGTDLDEPVDNYLPAILRHVASDPSADGADRGTIISAVANEQRANGHAAALDRIGRDLEAAIRTGRLTEDEDGLRLGGGE